MAAFYNFERNKKKYCDRREYSNDVHKYRKLFRFVHSDKKPYECLVCGMGFMRKPLLYAHMQTQGHLNDTIVVNQPRLTTDDDHIVTVNADGEMELVNRNDVEQITTDADADVSEDTKLYIAELKDHVIIQDDDNLYGNSKGAVIVGEPMEDENEEEDEEEYDAKKTRTIKHLIIGGRQLKITNAEQGGEDENDEEQDQDEDEDRDENEDQDQDHDHDQDGTSSSKIRIDDVREVEEEEEHVLTTQHILNEDGEYEEVIAADGLVDGNGQSIQTSSTIQLVQIRIPSANGEEEDAWVKIVPE